MQIQTSGKKFFLKRYLLDNAIWTVMSLKSVSVTYSETEGTILPNYNGTTQLLGMNPNWKKPGLGFVAGIQEPRDEFLDRALDKDWLVDEIFVSGIFSKTYSQQLNMRASIQPIQGLRIQLTATKQQSENTSKKFFYDDVDSNAYIFDPEVIGGNYSMSFLAFNTTFRKDDENTFSNQTFDELRANRVIISERLASMNDNSRGFAIDTAGRETEFHDGYGETAQEVLLYSFLSAYSGESASSQKIGDFTKLMPMPNWDVNYDGLSKIPLFKRYFQSVTLRHGYSSTFNISFSRNPVYDIDPVNMDPSVRDENNNNFIVDRQLANATISERFSPLISIDMKWKNSLITGAELRRDRSMALSFSNNQITEVVGKEYIISLGYRVSSLKLPFKVGKVEKASDLDLRADISIRDNQTVIRRIVENRNELTAGQRIFSIKFTADYRFSSKLNLRFYYDRVANTPRISSTFPTANTNAGLSLRFTLSQ